MPGSECSETSVSSFFTGLGITAAIDAMALPLRLRGPRSRPSVPNGITPFLLLLGGKWC
jgi:hypothetical protein